MAVMVSQGFESEGPDGGPEVIGIKSVSSCSRRESAHGECLALVYRGTARFLLPSASRPHRSTIAGRRDADRQTSLQIRASSSGLRTPKHRYNTNRQLLEYGEVMK